MSIIITITMRVMKHHMDKSIEPQVCKMQQDATTAASLFVKCLPSEILHNQIEEEAFRNLSDSAWGRA